MGFQYKPRAWLAEERDIGSVMMNRRDVLKRSAVLGIAATVPQGLCGRLCHALAAGAPPTPANPTADPKVYICPPCGLPCDKLTFDKPGTCPNCGMTLVPAQAGEDSPPSVAILLFNGAELIDFAGPWEVLGTAGFLVHTVAEKAELLTAVFGEKIMPAYTFDNSPKADILLVPGGGVWNEAIGNPKLIQWLQAQANQASHVMSVCTGAFLLNKAGLLAGQTVTTTAGMIEDLVAPDTKVVYDRRYVDSGKIITTAGLTAGIDGALHLVEKMLGRGAAQSAALSMEYNWDPSARYARAALADRYLPNRLADPRAKGATTKMVSTAGDTEHWETRILVSEPRSAAEIMELMRARIVANRATGGMFKRISHIQGSPRLVAAKAGQPNLLWSFTDDQNREWKGSCAVEPSTEKNGGFLVTFKLALSHRIAAR
jgi:putative intracellular protease/amidase